MNKLNTRTVLIVGAVLVGLVSVYLIANFAVPQVLVTLTKAAPAGKVSIQNSYVIGSKILARADGEDKCVVNVFLMDSNTRGVVGKSVQLRGMENIRPVKAALTDGNGMIGFEMTSTTEGQFKLTASVDGIDLIKGITVTFRNQ